MVKNGEVANPTCQTAKPTDGEWEEREAEILSERIVRNILEYMAKYGKRKPIAKQAVEDTTQMLASALRSAVLAERQSCIDAVEKSTERWRTNHETVGVEALLLAVEAINGK